MPASRLAAALRKARDWLARPLAPRPSRFARALAAYGYGNCLMDERSVWIGTDGSRDWPLAKRVLQHPVKPYTAFLEAPVQAELIAAFLASPDALQVEELFIGTSHRYPLQRTGDPRHFDMSAAVATLAGASLPALRTLSLGDLDDRDGGLRLFGTIGDIGHVFAAAPALQELSLFGNFALGRPARHDRLQALWAQFDHFGITGEPITQETFGNLLASRFPQLRTLSLDLDEGGGAEDDTLTIPEIFFDPAHLPSLAALDLDRIAPASRARLDAFMRERGIRDTYDKGAT